jgi:hypothetical protein
VRDQYVSTFLLEEGNDLRVQIQLDPRYEPFVDRATERDVLGEPFSIVACAATRGLPGANRRGMMLV